MNRVVVTGIGMVSPLASNVNDTWNQLVQSFAKNRDFNSQDYRKKASPMYITTSSGKLT